MITTETFHTASALRALRLINKARQCAKRKDVHGMYDYAVKALTVCVCAPAVPVADQKVANFVAHSVTYQISTLAFIANRCQCQAFVSLTRYILKDEVRKLIRALQKERGRRPHGLWS